MRRIAQGLSTIIYICSALHREFASRFLASKLHKIQLGLKPLLIELVEKALVFSGTEAAGPIPEEFELLTPTVASLNPKQRLGQEPSKATQPAAHVFMYHNAQPIFPQRCV